jgi:hypothetical protein
MTYEIKAHHTAHLTGTLAATGSLFIESSYGFNGGVAYLSGTSENDGSIFIDAQGGYPAGTRTGGGTLINQGVLTNVGRITVAGGGFYESRDGGDGGALINDGSLLNSGYIILGTAYASSLGFPGSKPGLLQDNGVLHNVGVIGINDYYDSYYNGHYGLTSGRLEVAGSLVNDGRINIGAAGYGGATIAVSGLLQNHAGGYVGSDAGGWALDVSASGIVQNAGTMVQGYTAPNYAPSIMAGLFSNTGVLALQDGESLEYHKTSGAAFEVTGRLDNTGAIDVSVNADSGRVSSPGGATLWDAGMLNNAGHLEVYGGVSSPTGLKAGGGGLLRVSGYMNNDLTGQIGLLGGSAGAEGAPGATLLLTGVLNNAGTITLAAGATAAGLTSGYGPSLIDNGFLLNTGSIVVPSGAGGGSPQLRIGADGTLVDRGQISGDLLLSSAGFLDLSGDGSSTGLIAATTLNNLGQLVGSGRITAVSLVNTGTIEAAGGVLTIDAAISGGGVFEAGPHGTLDLNGTITTGGASILFASGADAVLRASTSDLSAAPITGFAAGDGIDLTDLLPGGAPMLEFVQNGASGVLTIEENGHSAAITLVGQFDASAFTAASDGGIGTMITLHDATSSG